jgi:Icc protein
MHHSEISNRLISRRALIRRFVLAPATLALATRVAGQERPPRRLTFGLISDIHPDVMPDGTERVQAFAAAMKEARADFILQLGDFCWPHPRNQAFLDAWNAFGGPRHHVLGNHDMDGGCQREQTAAFYGMPGPHYAFQAGPVRGLVLDGNEPGGKAAGYKRFIGPAQAAWLEREMEQAAGPVLLFIHQPFDSDGDGCLENAAAIRALVERAQAAHPGRIVAVFSGHRHLDSQRVVNGVRHIQVNSASYWWLDNPAAHRQTYPPEVHKKYPYLDHVAAYRDPLWALVTLDFAKGELVIQGRHSEWIGPNPWQRGQAEDSAQSLHPRLHPWISDRREKIAI